MNSWISDQLNKIDLRSEKYCAEFDNIKKFYPIRYNYIKNYHQNLQCCYHCKCKVKCTLNINDVLDKCEQVLAYEQESDDQTNMIE